MKTLLPALIVLTLAACSPKTETVVEKLTCGSTGLFLKSHDACGAMDVKSVGDENGNHCKCFLGWAWTGSACEMLGDCACEGADCDKLTETKEACEAKHSTCAKPKLACGSSALHAATHDRCEAMDAVGGPDENGNMCRCMIGWAWNGSSCTGLGGCVCVGADCDKLTDTQEACEARHSGCSSTTGLSCGSSALHAKQAQGCAAMDAKAQGDANGHCLCFLGYAWNGKECAGLSDCTCVGADCDKLTLTLEDCQAKHLACAPQTKLTCGSTSLHLNAYTACAAMDARAVGDDSGAHCNCMLGYAWDGKDCVGLGDCACVGADCDKLEQTREACLARHSACK